MKYLKIICLLIIFFLYQLFPQSLKWEKVFDFNDNYNSFKSITKIDSFNLMALIDDESDTGPYRKIIKSSDGGLTWKTIYIDTVRSWHLSENICCADSNFCIATCDSNYILKTTDGGKNWEEKKIDVHISINGLISIGLFDSLRGVVSTLTNIAISDDGFKTYKQLTLPRKLIISDVKRPSPDLVYVLVTNTAGFLRYDIKNDVWDEYSLAFPKYDPAYNTPWSFYFLDSLNGITVGMRRSGEGGGRSFDMIHITTDGGRTWLEKLNAYNQPIFGLFYVDFCDRENGIAVGQFGKIYWTRDGGEIWVQDSSSVILKASSAVPHVVLLNKYTAVIANFEGTIYRSSLGTDVPEEKNNLEASLYPNPAEAYIYINLSQVFLPEKIKIYSVEGILVYQISGSGTGMPVPYDGNIKIDISTFAPGVYYVKVGDKVCRFIKI